jgi:hypothetical protein
MNSNEFDALVEEPDSGTNETEEVVETSGETQPATNSSDRGASQVAPQPTSEGQQPSLQERAPAVGVGDSEPGFPFETQESVYLTEESWNNYDDLKHTVETYLRSEFDIRNVQGRELDEVFFRLAVERLSKEEIGDLIVRLRGFNPDSER